MTAIKPATVTVTLPTTWIIGPGSSPNTTAFTLRQSGPNAPLYAAACDFTDEDLVGLIAAFMGKLIAHDPDAARALIVEAQRELIRVERERAA